MADSQREHKGNVLKPVLAGAALGAAVAASAVIMSDEKKRKQVMKTVHTVKDRTQKAMHQVKSKMNELQEGVDTLRDDAIEMTNHAEETGKRISA